MIYREYILPKNKSDIIRTLDPETKSAGFLLLHTGSHDNDIIIQYPVSDIDNPEFQMKEFIRFCKDRIDQYKGGRPKC